MSTAVPGVGRGRPSVSICISMRTIAVLFTTRLEKVVELGSSPLSIAGDPGARWKFPFAASTKGDVAPCGMLPVPLGVPTTVTLVPIRLLYRFVAVTEYGVALPL